jgi:transketolase
MPNMTVLAPGDGVEVRKAVFAVADHDGPVYLRLTRDPSPVVFDESYDFEIGRAVLVREGSDVTLITTGIMVGRAVEAAELLAAEDISAHLLHVHTVKPIDVAAIVAAAERTGLVVTAEEHNIIGGLGGAVAEVLGENRPTPMKRVGVADVYGESAADDDLLHKYGLTAGHIAEAARSLLERRRPTHHCKL